MSKEIIDVALEEYISNIERAITHVKVCLRGHLDRNGNYVHSSIDPAFALAWSSVLKRDAALLDDLLKKMVAGE